jgi:hypothetical protein
MKISARFLLTFAVVAAATIVALTQGKIPGFRSDASKGDPRTAWGAPDLQGIWNTNTFVPLERPAQYGTRGTMTEEEHAKALADLQERNKRPGRDSRDVAGKPGLGTEKDVARAYNEFWFGDKPARLSYRTSMIVDPQDGRIPALTPEAAKRIADKREFLAALLQGTSGGRPGPISPRRNDPSPDYNLDRVNRADGPEDRGGPERCFGDGVPVVLGTGTFGGVMQLVQSPDSVSMYYDVGQGSGYAWVVPITNRPHLPANVRLYRGDPIGHWENDTLVVDITNFSDETNFHGARENLHIVEKIKRVNANTLSVQFTAGDPTTWTRSWTAVQELEKDRRKDDARARGWMPRGELRTDGSADQHAGGGKSVP